MEEIKQAGTGPDGKTCSCKRTIRRTCPVSTVALAILLLLALPGFVTAKPNPRFRVLVLVSRAEDHQKMIRQAGPFLEKIAAENNFAVTITGDTSQVNTANLASYQVVVQLQEAPFDMAPDQQAALQAFVEQGKGWVGIHAAGLTGKQFLGPGAPYWQWFEDFMGGVIYSPHPDFQPGTVRVEDRTHPITRGLPAKFDIADEWYEFDKSPRGTVHVLAVADESTYKPTKAMGDHPIIWTNEHYRRMVYVGIGHDAALCRDPTFTRLVRNAIVWAASSGTSRKRNE